MSKKDLNAILKDSFKNHKEFSEIYLNFQKKLNTFKKQFFLVAVSGGPDSLALTALSKAYSYNNNCKIYYKHKFKDFRDFALQVYSLADIEPSDNFPLN